MQGFAIMRFIKFALSSSHDREDKMVMSRICIAVSSFSLPLFILVDRGFQPISADFIFYLGPQVHSLSQAFSDAAVIGTYIGDRLSLE
jgi:hypothetical protein